MYLIIIGAKLMYDVSLPLSIWVYVYVCVNM